MTNTPHTIENWERVWSNYFNSASSIDVGDEMAWHLLTEKVPVLFHLAKLGAMINTDEPTAELFRLAMIGMAHENERKSHG